MRGNKITQKIILGLIVFNLFFPQLIFAQTEIPEDYKEYLQIPEKDAKDILKSLSSFFRDLPYTSYDFLYSMEGTVLLTFQEFTKIDTWNFLTKELPAEIGFNIAKYSLEVAKVVGAGDFNSSMAKLLDLFEKESAKRATDYAIQELFKNEIKTAPGAFDVKYDGRNKQKYEARMQYIIVQKSLGDDRYSIAIKIFSPKAIEPPESSSSIGGLVGVPHEIPEGEKIPPFIIEVSGLMKKDNTGFYWIDEQGNRWQGETSIGKVPVGPKMIHVSFPEEVPDLGIQPRSFWEKNIVEPLKEKYKDFASIFEKFFGVEIINPEAQVAQEAASNEEESTEEAEEKQEELQLQPDNQQSQPKQQPAPSSSISSQTGQSSEAQSSTPSASSSTPSVSTPSVSSSSQASTDLSQLSEEEKNQILINIIYELQRRIQEQEQQKKAQQEEEERRQTLIKVIEELLRRQQEQQNQQQPADKQQQEKELSEQNKEQEEKTQQQEACQAKSININTAPANELQKIIGIGPTLAQRIIEARPFSSIKDLVKVNGIGDKTLEKIISQGCAYVVGDTGVLSDDSNSQSSSNNQNSSNNQGSDSNQNNNNQGNDVSPTVTFCSQKNLSGLVPALSPVIINEVAWMGNENSATQEWIVPQTITYPLYLG